MLAKNISFSIQNIFVGICTILIFLPYLSFLGLHLTDIKPDSLILCSFFLVVSLWLDPRFSKQITPSFGLCYIFVLLVYAFCMMFFYMDLNPRSLGGYLGLFVFFYFGFFYQRFFKNLFPILLFVISILLFVALVQFYVDRNFGVVFFDRFRSSPNRGVTSLTNEPSFYGNLCLFYLFALYLIWNKSWKYYFFGGLWFLLSVQILFFSSSVSATMGLVIFIGAHLLLIRNLRSLILVLACLSSFILMFHIYTKFFPLNRLSYVYSRFLLSPMGFFKIDQSIEQRFSDLYYTVLAFVQNLPASIGFGLDSWISYQYFFVERLPHKPFDILITNSIKSGFGAAIFQLGFLGAMLPFFVFWVFWRLPDWNAKVVGVSLLIYMFTTIPLAFPPFGFLLGYAYAMYSKENQRQQMLLSSP